MVDATCIVGNVCNPNATTDQDAALVARLVQYNHGVHEINAGIVLHKILYVYTKMKYCMI